ncbi:KCH1 [Candida jiufengensis]|uniref:KCH1 n=1 Tax=Candida jiufengensis TaxID=497108 RepID=UPI0022246265|nr:KCH1 [Candida jiufengensis]KAI5950172.1 KCH1 [Candida jiufengensis]
MADQKLKDHLDAEKAIKKYDLNLSTFNMIKIQDFQNYNCSTIFWYFYMWILVFLSIILLAIDIYSCLNILVFHRWATNDYKPYAYSIAKWIFTGCIIFQFVLLAYSWIWAIHIYRTKNIALVYLNSICKRVYSINNYNYFCLFNSIDEGKFFDACCFITYYEIQNALQILIADTPRQVINVLTLRYYATGGELNNDILRNIQEIAKTNLRLSIILSFMCLSVFIYAIFFFKFLFGMIMYIPLKCVLVDGKYTTFKSYCSFLINESVSQAVNKHHKPKRELIEEGILSEERANKLISLDKHPSDYKDYTRVYYSRTESSESFPLNDLTSSKTNLLNQTYNESRPFLHTDPSLDHLQNSQQQESTYSTLGNNNGQIPFNRRLSQLQNRNQSRNQFNNYRNPSQPFQNQELYQNNNNSNQLLDNDYNQYTEYNPQPFKKSINLPKQRNNSNNNYSNTRLPSKPSRSYTPIKGLESIKNQEHDNFESPEITLNNDIQNYPNKPLVKSSTEQFHQHQQNPKILQRSFTDELPQNLTRKKPNPFEEEETTDNFNFREPPNFQSNTISNSPPISKFEDEILDAYDTDNSIDNNDFLVPRDENIPYPVRGVSKYFDLEKQR